jgi:hypothetical protein
MNSKTEETQNAQPTEVESTALLGRASGEHAWTCNSLNAMANELRMKAVKCKMRYGNSHVKNGVEYLAGKYEEAAKVLEDALKSIDA